MSRNLTDPPLSTPNVDMPESSDPGRGLPVRAPDQMGSTTHLQLPELSVNASLEFWGNDSAVMDPRTTASQSGSRRVQDRMSEGGEEVMREGLRRAAEEADQPLEEHLRRSGVAILRDYDGQPDFFS